MQLNNREATVLREALLSSKDFREDCFVTEGVRFLKALGVSAHKRFSR